MLLNFHSTLNKISNSQPYGVNLLSYLAHSEAHSFDYHLCCEALYNRASVTDPQYKNLNYSHYESKVFLSRFNLMQTDNKAFALATKQNPTVKDLEEFSYIKPSWSVLYPIMIYLIHHPELIKEYDGLFPFGKNVIEYMSEFKPIKGQPTFSDHIKLRDEIKQLSIIWWKRQHIILLSPLVINIQCLDIPNLYQ